MHKKSSNKLDYGGARPKIQENKYVLQNESSSDDTGKKYQGPVEDKPLEKKEIVTFVNGVQMRKNALHPHWVEHKVFMEFSHPQFLSDSLLAPGGSETWLEEISFFCSDLERLLSLAHHKFWSQIIYDNGVHNCLDSFLSSRIRWFDNVTYNDEMILAAERADQLVFLVYLRMSTHKESKTEYISPNVFGELIYDNYIFDCCKFLDLCILYGHSNKKLLNKMIQNVFSNQPKYNNDLRMLITSLKNVLSNIEKELGIFPDKIPIPFKKLTDVVNFMVDNLFSVFSFLKVYPEAILLFYEEHYVERLALFYNTAIPFISENLSCHSQSGMEVDELKYKFEAGRIGALSLFRDTLNYLCIDPLRSNNSSTERLEECITLFITITTTAAEEKVFIADYNSMFGFADDLKLFKEAGADVTTLNYIKETISGSVTEAVSGHGSKAQFSDSKPIPVQAEYNHVDDTSGMNGYYNANQPESDIEVLSLIANIKDLLPDFGRGFIKECLKYYSFSVEDTLNAIFEYNLPPSLDCLDRTMDVESVPENKPSDQQEKLPSNPPAGSSFLEERGNIYNGDEFDTFSSKETLQKVRMGKKPNVLSAPDEDFVKKLKEIGREYDKNAGYSIYEDELKYTPIHAADYDDEYDDTYDSGYNAGVRDSNADEKGASIFGKGALNVKGIDFDATPSGSDRENEAEPATNQNISRATKRIEKRQNKKGPFNTKRGSTNDKLPNGQQNSAEAVSEAQVNPAQTENSQKWNRQPKSLDFCENPEDVRRRAEERRRTKMGANRRYGGIGEQQYRMPDNQPNGNVRPKFETKNSGKVWRQGDEGGGYKGGKEKETGDKKENAYKHKTIHKNEHKRFGAQAKQRGRF